VTHAAVLCGGASRGAYQIGAWKALEEAGVRLSAVSGVSIGGVNAAFVAMGDQGRAERAWLGLRSRQVFRVNGRTLKALWERGFDVLDAWRRDRPGDALVGAFEALEAWREGGAFDPAPLRRVIEEEIDPGLVRRSGVDCYVCHHRNGRIEYPNLRELDREELFDVLTAGCMLEFLYPSLFRSGETLGHAPAGTVPLAPFLRRKADVVWVVHLDPARKPADGAGRFSTFNLLPSCDFSRGFARGYLTVDPSLLEEWMRCGYRDAAKLLQGISGTDEGAGDSP